MTDIYVQAPMTPQQKVAQRDVDTVMLSTEELDQIRHDMESQDKLLMGYQVLANLPNAMSWPSIMQGIWITAALQHQCQCLCRVQILAVE